MRNNSFLELFLFYVVNNQRLPLAGMNSLHIF